MTKLLLNSTVSPKAEPPVFLKELLQARSPSGYEEEAREVVRKRVEKVTDEFFVDALGSCHAVLGNGQSQPYACRAPG